MFLNFAAAFCLFSLFLLGALGGRTPSPTFNDSSLAAGEGKAVDFSHD